MQELATLNINMRIITDENIDQLSSMNYINIDSFADFSKQIAPIQTKIKSELMQASATPQEPDAPDDAEEAEEAEEPPDAADAAEEIEPAAGVEMPEEPIPEVINQKVESAITANSSQLGQVINDNFVQTPEEQAQSQAQEQMEEISLDKLIPNQTSQIPNSQAISVNDIVNPEDNLSKFNEEAAMNDESGSQSGESGSQSGESGSQSGESGSQSGESGNSSSQSSAKVIKLD
jgi:hypothetical protein